MHRKAENRLAESHKEMGRINGSCEDEIRAEMQEPTDMLGMEVGSNGVDVFY